MAKEPDIEELVWDLEGAMLEFKINPLLGQIEALKAIARNLRRCVPDGLLEPIESIYTNLMNQAAEIVSDNRPGPRPAPLDTRMVEAYAAATVTVLKKCGWKVGDAITKVAEATGIDAKRLRDFRDEIHRGRVDQLVLKIYSNHVKRFTKTPFTPEENADWALHCTQFFTVGRPFKFDFSDL